MKRRLDKQAKIFSYGEILLGNKQERTNDTMICIHLKITIFFYFFYFLSERSQIKREYMS